MLHIIYLSIIIVDMGFTRELKEILFIAVYNNL